MKPWYFWCAIGIGGYAYLLTGYYLFAPFYWKVWREQPKFGLRALLAYPLAAIRTRKNERCFWNIRSEESYAPFITIFGSRDCEAYRNYTALLWPIALTVDVVYLAGIAIYFGIVRAVTSVFELMFAAVRVPQYLASARERRKTNAAPRVHTGPVPAANFSRSDGRQATMHNIDLQIAGIKADIEERQRELARIEQKKHNLAATVTS